MDDVQSIISIFVFVIVIIIRIIKENKKNSSARTHTSGTTQIVSKQSFQSVNSTPQYVNSEYTIDVETTTETTTSTETKSDIKPTVTNIENSDIDNSKIEQWRQAIISAEILKTKF